MRKQIAAGNWKMNLSYQEADGLLGQILKENIELQAHQQVIFAVPFPYLVMARSAVGEEKNYEIAAQNCHEKEHGAYTGEVSAAMLHSIGVRYCILGHSERRQYFNEDSKKLSEKLNACLAAGIQPIFCCGEPLEVREAGEEKNYVQQQLEEALFHLSEDEMKKLIVAYEPIWAIGTGRTASAAQAQEMHAHIRSVLKGKFGESIAEEVPILYGGSVKGSNAKELFAGQDVDGGLVGGASPVAAEFVAIIKALKQ